MEKDIYQRPAAGQHPANLSPAYKSTPSRSPRMPAIALPQSLSEITGPLLAGERLNALENDLTKQRIGEPLGERIVVHGRVLDENGKPVPDTLVEFWQANAGGRYRHRNDTYIAPIDPNFGGCGRMLTDERGYYFFRTIKPGAYPFRNRINSWRPAHIHFSVFGTGFAQRLITQMYFEGDPLIPHDSIIATIPDKSAADRLTAKLDLNVSRPLECLAYRFDIVLRGRRQTLFENKLQGG